LVDRIGQSSNQANLERVARLADRLARLRVDDPPRRRKPLRRRRSISEAIITVLGSCGEQRARDVHAAVEALLGESMPLSSVKNCLARNARGEDASFERVGRGRYRLRAVVP
jgi:hypothetical protein